MQTRTIYKCGCAYKAPECFISHKRLWYLYLAVVLVLVAIEWADPALCVRLIGYQTSDIVIYESGPTLHYVSD